MIFNLSEQDTIANQFIAEMRHSHIQTDRLRFRHNMEKMGQVLAYEISKTLTYEEREIDTPLGTAMCRVPTDRVILSTIMRAGLPFHQGFLNVFDNADNAFISAYRKHHKDGTFDIELDYVSCPNLDDSVLIICDAMIATGASIDLALNELLAHGKPRKIHVATVIASTNGMEYMQRMHGKADYWLGALDDELTAKSYIVPGLGDAGDLSYGEKIQE